MGLQIDMDSFSKHSQVQLPCHSFTFVVCTEIVQYLYPLNTSNVTRFQLAFEVDQPSLILNFFKDIFPKTNTIVTYKLLSSRHCRLKMPSWRMELC